MSSTAKSSQTQSQKQLILVTGSSGHLGEALMRSLPELGYEARGLDILPSEWTNVVASLLDDDALEQAFEGVTAVLHTATLHKPHVATHSRQSFIDTNITGTLKVLEAAVRHNLKSVIFTSTTSAFGASLRPQAGQPAVWVTESLPAIAKNIYGLTKVAAEELCQLFHRKHKLPSVVLRTSRFFPEDDDDASVRDKYLEQNVKALEFLYRRVDIEDIVSAQVLALERAQDLGFERFIVSATSAFKRSDCRALRDNPAQVIHERVPEAQAIFDKRGWRIFDSIDRVYVNDHAREVLGWQPKYDFRAILKQSENGQAVLSPLAQLIGRKGYHSQSKL